MNHSFIKGSIVNGTAKCAKCQYDEMSHTAYAQCEACPNKGQCEIINNLLLCKECYEKESKLPAPKRNDLAEFANAIEIKPSDVIERLARKLEVQNIETSQDYFNAETLSIGELEQSIMKDESIKEILSTDHHFSQEGFQALLVD